MSKMIPSFIAYVAGFGSTALGAWTIFANILNQGGAVTRVPSLTTLGLEEGITYLCYGLLLLGVHLFRTYGTQGSIFLITGAATTLLIIGAVRMAGLRITTTQFGILDLVRIPYNSFLIIQAFSAMLMGITGFITSLSKAAASWALLLGGFVMTVMPIAVLSVSIITPVGIGLFLEGLSMKQEKR